MSIGESDLDIVGSTLEYLAELLVEEAPDCPRCGAEWYGNHSDECILLICLEKGGEAFRRLKGARNVADDDRPVPNSCGAGVEL